ncbi:MAG: metallophosphoesterase [Bacteroidota bacterium]
MKIQYCSDLHLEFPDNREYIRQNPIKPVGDILILAGDIIPFARRELADNFFDTVSNDFKQVYWVPGNHEYYGYNIQDLNGLVSDQIRDNVWLTSNSGVVTIEGVNLIFSTLWSKISLDAERIIQRSVSDFRNIGYQSQNLTVANFNQMHHACLSYIWQSLPKDKGDTTIVVTHHVPTFLNYPAEYQGDIINEAFGVELHDLIHDANIDHWIYGHHHRNIPDFEVNGTKLTTNQLGYLHYGEQAGFDATKIIEI